MNRQRRKKLSTAVSNLENLINFIESNSDKLETDEEMRNEISENISSVAEDIYDICDEEQFAYDMETSLNMPWENVEKVIECIDEFYVDIKTYDEDKYLQYTGHSGKQAFDNLSRLLEICPNKVIVRVPVIPELTTAEDCDGYIDKLKDIGAVKFNRFVYKKCSLPE